MKFEEWAQSQGYGYFYSTKYPKKFMWTSDINQEWLESCWDAAYYEGYLEGSQEPE